MDGDFLHLRRKARVPEKKGEKDKLKLCVVDCDYTVEKIKSVGNPNALEGQVPVIRIFGLTEQGASVVAKVHGFKPYLYARLNMTKEQAEKITPADLLQMRRHLNRLIKTPEAQDTLATEEDFEHPVLHQSHEIGHVHRTLDKLGSELRRAKKQVLAPSKKPSVRPLKRKVHPDDGGDDEPDEEEFDDVSDDEDAGMDQEVSFGDDPDEDENNNRRRFHHEKKYRYDTGTYDHGRRPPAVRQLKVVMNRSIYGYCGKELSPFLRIVVDIPQSVPKVRRVLEDGTFSEMQQQNIPISLMGDINPQTGRPRFFRCYQEVFEANIEFSLRFLIDHGISGCGWLEISNWTKPRDQDDPKALKKNWCVRPNREESQPDTKKPTNWYELPEKLFLPENLDSFRSNSSGFSYPQIIELHSDNVIGIPYDKPGGSEMPALRTVCFDIEVAGRKSRFPVTCADPTITVAFCAELEQGRMVAIVLQLGICGRPPWEVVTDAEVAGYDKPMECHLLSFTSERDLLLTFQSLFVHIDPDLVKTYNGNKFDFPYLLERGEAFGIAEVVACLGRVRGEPSIIRDGKFSSRAFGTSTTVDIVMPGRAPLDMMIYMERNYKLRSYSLNAVSAKYLKETKLDVSHTAITPMWLAGGKDISKLVAYCAKDAYLPQRLAKVLKVDLIMVEMCRITGVLLPWLLSKGQSIKVFSQILRASRERGYLVPSYSVPEGASSDYEGATVVKPDSGYYKVPIPTLDFASLYPSIMMSHNLCYTTYLKDKAEAEKYGLELGKGYKIMPSNDLFAILPDGEKPLLPDILENLLTARKQAKKRMQELEDEGKMKTLEYEVLDTRQAQLKVSANSIYGFTGATIGKLPCLPIGRSVTSEGRRGLELVRKVVESPWMYNPGNMDEPLEGIPNPCAGAKVIYGDTDSVMILPNFTEEEKAIFQSWDHENQSPEFTALLQRVINLFTRVAIYVTKFFKAPMKLEFEKVYFPYLLIIKKRYSGLKWTKAEIYEKHDVKGLETGRRDNCVFAARVQAECLKIFNFKLSAEKAIDYVIGEIGKLFRGEIPMEELVISKQYAREDYKSPQPHVKVREKMMARDPDSAPVLGSRIPYIMKRLPFNKNAKACDKAEDPMYMITHSEQPDYEYYLEKQLRAPLTRIFEKLMPNPEIMFNGPHTRVRDFRLTAPHADHGLFAGGHFKILNSCLECKVAIPATAPAQDLCPQCESQRPQVLIHTRNIIAEAQQVVTTLWDACRVCVKNMIDPEQCSNAACHQFYTRQIRRRGLKRMRAVEKRILRSAGEQVDEEEDDEDSNARKRAKLFTW